MAKKLTIEQRMLKLEKETDYNLKNLLFHVNQQAEAVNQLHKRLHAVEKILRERR